MNQPNQDKTIKVDVTCPACRLVVEVVIREMNVISRGNGVLEATLEGSTYRHKCQKLGGMF